MPNNDIEFTDKEELFNRLWIDHEWCEMGYNYRTLFDRMTKTAILKKLKELEG